MYDRASYLMGLIHMACESFLIYEFTSLSCRAEEEAHCFVKFSYRIVKILQQSSSAGLIGTAMLDYSSL